MSEANTDVVAFIYREEQYRKRGENKNIAEEFENPFNCSRT